MPIESVVFRSNLLRACRIRYGDSQSQFAERLGYHKSSLSKWESKDNAACPPIEVVKDYLRRAGLPSWMCYIYHPKANLASDSLIWYLFHQYWEEQGKLFSADFPFEPPYRDGAWVRRLGRLGDYVD